MTRPKTRGFNYKVPQSPRNSPGRSGSEVPSERSTVSSSRGGGGSNGSGPHRHHHGGGACYFTGIPFDLGGASWYAPVTVPLAHEDDFQEADRVQVCAFVAAMRGPLSFDELRGFCALVSRLADHGAH